MRELLKRMTFPRRLLTVGIAYCVALQMLFAGALASQHAALGLGSSDPAVICFGNVPVDPANADDSGASAVRLLPCMVMGFAAAAPVPDFAFDLFAPTRSSERISSAFDRRAALASPQPSPRLSQGPPQA
jgi:hypothetical protein